MLRRNVLTLCLAALCAQAAVTRVEITERADLPTANYERITGKVYFAVDPKLPNNQIIRDIALAPVNAKGLVEFSSDLYVLRPKDPKKSNGTALLEISNRGGKGMQNTFDFGADDPNQMLLESGYTLVWVGWEWDMPAARGLDASVRAGDQRHHRAGAVADRDGEASDFGVAGRSRADAVCGGRSERRRANRAR